MHGWKNSALCFFHSLSARRCVHMFRWYGLRILCMQQHSHNLATRRDMQTSCIFVFHLNPFYSALFSTSVTTTHHTISAGVSFSFSLGLCLAARIFCPLNNCIDFAWLVSATFRINRTVATKRHQTATFVYGRFSNWVNNCIRSSVSSNVCDAVYRPNHSSRRVSFRAWCDSSESNLIHRKRHNCISQHPKTDLMLLICASAMQCCVLPFRNGCDINHRHQHRNAAGQMPLTTRKTFQLFFFSLSIHKLLTKLICLHFVKNWNISSADPSTCSFHLKCNQSFQ